MAANILWVGYPRAYTKGRLRKPQVIVLHYTAGSEGPTSAEGGARYDKTRTDGTSTHYFTDSEGPALQEVPDGDRAHAARQRGNEIGIQIEICGTIQTRKQWLDDTSRKTLLTTAALVAELIRRHGIAFKRLTDLQLKNAYYNDRSITGIVEHANCTRAFPEDQGSHMDLGPEFPWDVFMDMVGKELGGSAAPVEGDDEMAQVFLWQGNIWISRGGAMQREKVCPLPTGTATSPEANVVCDAHQVYPGQDGRKYPTPDLKDRGWTEALVDLTFGKVAGSTNVVIDYDKLGQEIADSMPSVGAADLSEAAKEDVTKIVRTEIDKTKLGS